MIGSRSLVMFAALSLAGCHERPHVPRAEVGAKHAVGKVVAPGTVEPLGGEVRLTAIERGRLADVLVTEGASVEAGQLLARLEDSAERALVTVAQAEHALATAQLSLLDATRENLLVARAEVDGAAARLAKAKQDAARTQALALAGASPLDQSEQSLTEVALATAALDGAEARSRLAHRGASSAERRVARARVDAMTARLGDAQAALARREVRAPIAGIVLWSRAHAGEYATPEAGPLMILGRVDRLQVRLEVDELDAADVALGTRCSLRNDAGLEIALGRVTAVAPQYGVRVLSRERPTLRTDARVREVLVEVDGAHRLAPGLRLWGELARGELHASAAK